MNRQLLHTPEGVRDIYGKEYAGKLAVEELIHNRLNLYGYQDIQTPTFEFFDVFSRETGTTPSKDLYKFFDKEGNTLVLRPDFTPSMARCAAKYFMDEDIPVRFCYVGNTFTNTSSLQGKLKEVTQMGAELICDGTPEADGEMIAMVVESLLAAGLKEFQVSIGQIEYFKGICAQAGLDEQTESELRKFISGKNIFGAQELLAGCGLKESHCDMLLKVTDCFGSMEILKTARELVSNERSLRAVERLEKLYQVLCQYGVEKYISFDLGMLSKYNYYTGVIFKVYTYGVGEPVVKGGRYDNLLGYFGKEAPAIGFAVVIDDLLLALARQNTAFVKEDLTYLTYNDSSYASMLAKAKELRARGKRTALIPEQANNPKDYNPRDKFSQEDNVSEADNTSQGESHGQEDKL
ncbi:MAG: ATP phosphoribosyltransferase regulatory subunit [Lachnospiraceae bacterium]|nr:ATP phosphoribosyltransferase regulatory subunit [Lachnospiraceae bacterium]